MIRVDIEETIDRPIEEVFEKIVDISSYNEWMPRRGLFISCRKESDGPAGLGTVYSDRTWLGTISGSISEFDKPRKVTFHYTAPFLWWTMIEGWPGYTLERKDDTSTTVHHHAEGRLYGPFKLLRPLMRRVAQGERRRTLDALKATLKSS